MTVPAVSLPAASAVAPVAAPSRGGDARFGRLVLGLSLACALVPAALLAAGFRQIAGLIFWPLLAVTATGLAALRRSDALLALMVSLFPFMNLLRNEVFYNVVGVALAAAILVRVMTAPSVGPFFRRHPLLLPLAAYLLLYWAFSFAGTGRYDSNSRAWEFLFAILAVLFLARHRPLLAVALRGLATSAALVGAAMLPHVGGTAEQRLGLILLEGRSLGNPIQLGAPLALALLALLAERGRWIGAEGRPGLRAGGIAVIATLLLLTTSRTAWAIGAVGLLVILLFGSRNRGAVILALLAGVIAFQLIRWSPFGGALDAAIDRTFGEGRTASGRTSGRSDQWVVTYSALTESATSLLVGHGLGKGPAVYARKSIDLADVDFEVGREMALHSLFMQILVEAGILGLVPLLVWLAVVTARAVRWARRCRELVPLLGVLSFTILAWTVSAMDTVSGVFLALGLLASARPARVSAALAPGSPRSRRP